MMASVGRAMAGFGVLLSLFPSYAAMWYADASAGASGDGTSWDTAFLTIQEGVDAAINGDTIFVAPGTYGGISVQYKTLSVRSLDPHDPEIVEATRIAYAWFRGADGSVIEGFTFCEVGLPRAGIFCRESNVAILRNVIFGRTASDEGLIDCRNCSPLIGWNLIAGNSGAFNGAVLCVNSSPTIISNTIADNSSRSGLGGVVADDESFPQIVNCVIWNDGEDLFNCSATYSCIEDAYGGAGNIATEPYFVDPENGDYRLLPWSPCIDAGDPGSDFAREPEPNGGQIDIGAYGNTPTATSKSPDNDTDGLPDDWEITKFGTLDQTGTDDVDGDAILNIHEYRYGWDPNAADSVRAQNVTSGRFYKTIQAAICEASDGDEIVVSQGTHYEQVSFFGKAITLRSVNPSDADVVAGTLIDGGWSGSTVRFCSGESAGSILTGLTVTGGTSLKGGGVRCSNSSPTIRNNTIRGNVAYQILTTFPGDGGGIHSLGGSPTIEGNLIVDNTASPDGAGIYCGGGAPSILRNTVTGNFAWYRGGGIHCCDTQDARIIGNVISDNDATLGAGLSLLRCSEVQVSCNLITENGRHVPGGGAYFNSAAGSILNCTIAANDDYAIMPGHVWNSLEIINCIVWGRADSAVHPETLNFSYSCLDRELPGEGNIVADPLFVDAANGDFHLSPGSPCIDAGHNDAPNLPETDILGNPRILYGGRSFTVDMGAYEYVIARMTPGPGPDEATFTWSSLADKVYSVLFSQDMLNWHVADDRVLSQGNMTTSWIDDGSKTGTPVTLARRRFYRAVMNP